MDKSKSPTERDDSAKPLSRGRLLSPPRPPAEPLGVSPEKIQKLSDSEESCEGAPSRSPEVSKLISSESPGMGSPQSISVTSIGSPRALSPGFAAQISPGTPRALSPRFSAQVHGSQRTPSPLLEARITSPGSPTRAVSAQITLPGSPMTHSPELTAKSTSRESPIAISPELAAQSTSCMSPKALSPEFAAPSRSSRGSPRTLSRGFGARSTSRGSPSIPLPKLEGRSTSRGSTRTQSPRRTAQIVPTVSCSSGRASQIRSTGSRRRRTAQNKSPTSSGGPVAQIAPPISPGVPETQIVPSMSPGVPVTEIAPPVSPGVPATQIAPPVSPGVPATHIAPPVSPGVSAPHIAPPVSPGVSATQIAPPVSPGVPVTKIAPPVSPVAPPESPKRLATETAPPGSPKRLATETAPPGSPKRLAAQITSSGTPKTLSPAFETRITSPGSQRMVSPGLVSQGTDPGSPRISSPGSALQTSSHGSPRRISPGMEFVATLLRKELSNQLDPSMSLPTSPKAFSPEYTQTMSLPTSPKPSTSSLLPTDFSGYYKSPSPRSPAQIPSPDVPELVNLGPLSPGTDLFMPGSPATHDQSTSPGLPPQLSLPDPCMQIRSSDSPLSQRSTSPEYLKLALTSTDFADLYPALSIPADIPLPDMDFSKFSMTTSPEESGELDAPGPSKIKSSDSSKITLDLECKQDQSASASERYISSPNRQDISPIPESCSDSAAQTSQEVTVLQSSAQRSPNVIANDSVLPEASGFESLSEIDSLPNRQITSQLRSGISSEVSQITVSSPQIVVARSTECSETSEGMSVPASSKISTSVGSPESLGLGSSQVTIVISPVLESREVTFILGLHEGPGQSSHIPNLSSGSLEVSEPASSNVVPPVSENVSLTPGPQSSALPRIPSSGSESVCSHPSASSIVFEIHSPVAGLEIVPECSGPSGSSVMPEIPSSVIDSVTDPESLGSSVAPKVPSSVAESVTVPETSGTSGSLVVPEIRSHVSGLDILSIPSTSSVAPEVRSLVSGLEIPSGPSTSSALPTMSPSSEYAVVASSPAPESSIAPGSSIAPAQPLSGTLEVAAEGLPRVLERGSPNTSRTEYPEAASASITPTVQSNEVSGVVSSSLSPTRNDNITSPVRSPNVSNHDSNSPQPSRIISPEPTAETAAASLSNPHLRALLAAREAEPIEFSLQDSPEINANVAGPSGLCRTLSSLPDSTAYSGAESLYSPGGASASSSQGHSESGSVNTGVESGGSPGPSGVRSIINSPGAPEVDSSTLSSPRANVPLPSPGTSGISSSVLSPGAAPILSPQASVSSTEASGIGSSSIRSPRACEPSVRSPEVSSGVDSTVGSSVTLTSTLPSSSASTSRTEICGSAVNSPDTSGIVASNLGSPADSEEFSPAPHTAVDSNINFPTTSTSDCESRTTDAKEMSVFDPNKPSTSKAYPTSLDLSSKSLGRRHPRSLVVGPSTCTQSPSTESPSSDLPSTSSRRSSISTNVSPVSTGSPASNFVPSPATQSSSSDPSTASSVPTPDELSRASSNESPGFNSPGPSGSNIEIDPRPGPSRSNRGNTQRERRPESNPDQQSEESRNIGIQSEVITSSVLSGTSEGSDESQQ